MASVKFGKFKMSRAGYAALMGSGPVQSVLRGKAEAVRSAADGMLSNDGYKIPGHEAKQFQGKLARGYVVRSKSDHARYSQARHKTLSKALNSAAGGA